MFKTPKNLCKSVKTEALFNRQWQDEVYLASACKERFMVLSEIPELKHEEIAMAGLGDFREAYSVERREPEIHTILFTLEGGGCLYTRHGVHAIQPNSVTVLPQGLPFRFELGEHAYWKMAWVLLPPSGKWQTIALSEQRVESSHLAESVWSLLNLTQNEIHGRATFRQLLLSELSRILMGSTEDNPSSAAMRVHRVFTQVEAQLHLPWSVKEIAQRSFLSEEQLNRLSKQLYQCSPSQKLIQLRMEKACDLLHHRDWSITMIAHRLGYPDPYNFTHRFRRVYGISPREYRKSCCYSQE
ncbi:helix-turn-helix transcriptional regulator [Vibrio aphrogenes]|uniref:helix-turn-helix transcriptional regulator n=1 Tax=Vibrio aphrogenes TaxID=1891186 RepID=UPI000B355F34|nr:AraC family transcriptional regulator [Vibrio aphrogenes]